MTVEDRIRQLGLQLPQAPARGGAYTPLKMFSTKLVYASGFGSATADWALTGRLGAERTVEEGAKAAENCVLNMLAAYKRDIGELDTIKSFVKMLALVSSANDFYQQPKVADGATRLLTTIFGEEAGSPARSAIGVNVLPGNIPVEIEALIELK